jgi:hypothetical protein
MPSCDFCHFLTHRLVNAFVSKCNLLITLRLLPTDARFNRETTERFLEPKDHNKETTEQFLEPKDHNKETTERFLEPKDHNKETTE